MRLVIALLFVVLSSCAHAQEACGTRSDIVNRLEQGYNEHQVAVGLSSGGMMIELWTSRKGTFTIFATTPDGISCLLTSGEGWIDLTPKGIEL